MSRIIVYHGSKEKWQPETKVFLQHADVNIPNDGTVYFASTAFEKTGNQIWETIDSFVVTTKIARGLTLGVNNLKDVYKFLYLFIGGTATSHKVNFVTPGTFDLTLFGGITHSGGGIQFGGVNGYADTNCPMGALLPAAQNFDGNDNAFGIYSRTNTAALECEIFCADGANNEVYLYSKSGAGNLLTRNGATGTNHQTAVADSLAHTSLSRVNNTEYKVFKRGVLVDTYSQASTTHCAEVNILIGAIGGPSQFTSKELTAAYGGVGMTPTEMGDFDAALEQLQVDLNRNV